MMTKLNETDVSDPVYSLNVQNMTEKASIKEQELNEWGLVSLVLFHWDDH